MQRLDQQLEKVVSGLIRTPETSQMAFTRVKVSALMTAFSIIFKYSGVANKGACLTRDPGFHVLRTIKIASISSSIMKQSKCDLGNKIFVVVLVVFWLIKDGCPL